jgi:hypothetical protein
LHKREISIGSDLNTWGRNVAAGGSNTKQNYSRRC